MHAFRFAYAAVLAFFALTIPSLASAQEVLVGDGGFPGIRAMGSSVQRNGQKATATAPFPFFDDFSGRNAYPDTSKWISNPESDSRLPTISIERGRNAPSKGVLSFDGATHKKRKHRNLLETDYQDVLTSQSFDLSGFNPSDELYISFFYQRGGWGDAPEASDSLILSFDTTGAGDFIPVWTANGTGAAESNFTLVNLPLLNGAFFHPEFRFRFESYGSLNGELDVWHIDYVYFAANRGPEDTLFSDISPTKMLDSPLGDYTALPRDHYIAGGFNAAPSVEVSNVSGPQQGAPVELLLTESTGNNALSGTVTHVISSGFLAPYANATVATPPFSDQAANMNQMGTLRLTTVTRAAADSRPQNDSLVREYRIDSVHALDDGQPDAGYGLTTARSFCMEFRIPEPDTLSAVWIAFEPTLNYNPVINQSTCMDGATFKLTLWDTLYPDSFRTQQSTGMVIRYDSADNYFQRFTFINPQVVDTLFYLGIRQNTDRPLGVGFDKQGPSGRLFFENGLALFTPSSQNGSVMIRPEFARIKDGEVTVARPSFRQNFSGKLYPNPWSGGEIWLETKGQALASGTWKLVDLQGRAVAGGRLQQQQQRMGLELSDGLAPGMYLLLVEGKSLRGEHLAFQKRLLVQK